MRTSLARVELAASRLARDAATPAARDLATGISEAVLDIDDEIGEALRTLRSEPDTGNDFEDCSPILAALRERITPILRAHGISWLRLGGEDEVVIADRVAVELAALVMLRTGIAQAGHGGAIQLSLVRDARVPCIGLCLTTHPGDGHIADADALVRARTLAQRHGSSLVVRHSEGSLTATLWLTRSEAK